MTAAQHAMLWSLWDRCRAYYRSQGMTAAQAEDKRRALIAEALGAPRSLSEWKRWKNPEVDAVKKKFLSICEGGNLNAQLDDSPALRRQRVFNECLQLAGAIKDVPPQHPDFDYVVLNYLNALARKICFKKAEECSDAELNKVKGALVVHLKRLETEAQRTAAGVEEDHPF